MAAWGNSVAAAMVSVLGVHIRHFLSLGKGIDRLWESTVADEHLSVSFSFFLSLSPWDTYPLLCSSVALIV